MKLNFTLLTERETRIMNKFSDKVFITEEGIQTISEDYIYYIEKEMFKQEGKYYLNKNGFSFIGNKIEVPKMTLPFVKTLLEVSLNKNIIKYVLEACEFTEELSKNEYGLNNKLSCVYLKCKSNKLTIYATDSYRCYIKKDIPLESEGFHIYLNARCLKNIKNEVNKYDDVSVVLREDSTIGLNYGNKKMYHKYFKSNIDEKLIKSINRWVGIFNDAQHSKIDLNEVDLKILSENYRKNEVPRANRKLRLTYLGKYSKLICTPSKKDEKKKDFLFKEMYDINLDCEDFSLVINYSYLKKALSKCVDKSFYLKSNIIENGLHKRGVQAIFKTKRDSLIFVALCVE